MSITDTRAGVFRQVVSRPLRSKGSKYPKFTVSAPTSHTLNSIWDQGTWTHWGALSVVASMRAGLLSRHMQRGMLEDAIRHGNERDGRFSVALHVAFIRWFKHMCQNCTRSFGTRLSAVSCSICSCAFQSASP